MYKRIIATLAILCALTAVGARAEIPLADVLAKLRGVASGADVKGWRYTSADVPGAEKPDFDDSAWQTADPEFDYGAVPVAWMRATVEIPRKVGGMPVTGTKVILRAGVDDDGECYVNGDLKQKFHWDQCAVVLTESARPGEKYRVAIKGLNGPGSGRLLFARLEFAALSEMCDDASNLALEIEYADRLASQSPDHQAVAYRAAVGPAVAAIDLPALDRGDKASFEKSIPVARKALTPVVSDMKALNLHLVGHAHIDMNWLWLWPETVDVCKNTFGTMIKLMDEYPELRFSQSQASTYIAVEEADPSLFARIQDRVRRGQWEVTGGTWVEGDQNMASGESIVRQILYAKQYFREKFGVEPVVGWEPDTFGHAWTIPQIFAKSGIKYYYFMRAGKGEPIFWWEGPDGSRLLAYNRGSYNGSVHDDAGDSVLEMNKKYGVNDGLLVYGVGDHGGGPTRGDISKALVLQKRDVYPTVKFDTAQGFFDAVLAQKTDWPVINGELNTVFEGCYTSHGDIKKMNRVSENLLPTAEMFSALASPYGFLYPGKGFVTAWRNTCFNQFHDIFDGTAIHGSYAYSRKLFDTAYGIGSDALRRSLDAISANVDTTGGKGIPVVVFNPLSWTRTDAVRMPIPDQLRGKYIVVRDAKGAEQSATVREDEVFFTANDVPAVGYKVYYLAEQPPYSTVGGGDFIDNEFFKVQVDMTTGAVIDIYDKKAGRSILPKGMQADVLQFLHEGPHHMSAWGIGDITKTEAPTLDSVQVISQSPVGILRVKHTFKSSRFTQDIILHPGVPRIDFKMTADWRETGSASSGGAMLKVAFPVDVAEGKATYEIPFGSVERPTGGHEYPGQKWIDLSGKDYGVSLLNDCKYGHDVNGNVMRLTLLRSPDDPDSRSDVGRHDITYSLYPHQGDWRQADSVRRGYELNNPLIPVVAADHAGKLPKEHSFLGVEPSNVIVTALKKAEAGDGLILRFYECEGTPGEATIRFGAKAGSVRETDLMERPTGYRRSVTGGKVRIPLGKWEIKTFHISE